MLNKIDVQVYPTRHDDSFKRKNWNAMFSPSLSAQHHEGSHCQGQNYPISQTNKRCKRCATNLVSRTKSNRTLNRGKLQIQPHKQCHAERCENSGAEYRLLVAWDMVRQLQTM